jgi:DNA-binding GntR family transcriptional regulator
VYQFVQNQIMSLDLPPGARIEERLIVDKLRISRTPIRQAFMRLASEGLIETLPNRGVRVARLDFDEVRAFFEVFGLMQKAINHLAAKRRTAEDIVALKSAREDYDRAAQRRDALGMVETNRVFHLSIARASHNSHLERLTKDLLIKAVRLEGIWHHRYDEESLARDIQKSREEHNALVKTIVAQDIAGAEGLALDHIRSFREPLLEYLSESVAEEFSING